MVTDHRCCIRGCQKFIDDRSGDYSYCTDDLIAHLFNRVAELEKTRRVMEDQIVALNHLVAEAIDEDRL